MKGSPPESDWLSRWVDSAKFAVILRFELNRPSCNGRLTLVVNTKQCAQSSTKLDIAIHTVNLAYVSNTDFAFMNNAG